MSRALEAKGDDPVTTFNSQLSALRTPLNAKVYLLPIIAGILAALGMLGLYLGILSVLQSFSHALEQLSTDRLWVGLVATGFGVQIGLYTYLRAIVQAAKAVGATAMTGAGTGTSTVGMLACCAHHISDVAPLLGLTGATGLSGAVTFLAEYKIRAQGTRVPGRDERVSYGGK